MKLLTAAAQLSGAASALRLKLVRKSMAHERDEDRLYQMECACLEYIYVFKNIQCRIFKQTPNAYACF